uniref:Uncharacterized protein n=1 Tax=Siphoviridae sp. ctsxw88 TaxID=2825701 RepID=A0A8S5PHX0_9CAUD|nr:MAG TPA: hypothetical protein [Siphoviridae sp. ctsxw88]
MGQKIEVTHQRTITTLRKRNRTKPQKRLVLRKKNKNKKG